MSVHLDNHVGVVRKPHQCRVCGERIAKGEAGMIYRGIDEDGPYTIYFHHECWAGSRDWTEDEWESCGPGDVTRDEIRDAAQAAGETHETL